MKIFTYLLLILALGLKSNPIQGGYTSLPPYMYHAAHSFSIDISLLYAFCQVESKCKPKALNKDDATADKKSKGIIEHSLGMFQLKLATVRNLGFVGSKKDLMRPETNTWYAAKLIRHLYSRYGHDTIKVISAYNAGHYTRKNNKYVSAVLERYVHHKIDRRL